VLDYTASFTNFATEFLRKNKIDEDFEITPGLLDEFYAFVAERNIQPRLAEWLAERDFISNRLKTEIFNQAIGVEKGDQVELRRDPVVQKALEIVGN
jgi:hypothetical protein